MFDAAIVLLILFPLLTGGAWIHRPGLSVELSELAVPVLVTALIGAILGLGLHRPIARGAVVRGLLALWRWWERLVYRSRGRALWVAAAADGALLSLASLRRHWAYQSSSFDLGIFTNLLWNLTHGHGYVSAPRGGINLMTDHQSPILALIAPLYALWPKPELLLVLQAFALAAGGVSLFYLGAQYRPARRWVAAALPLLYWAYLPIRNANAFEFHPETLMLPLMLWGIVGLQSGARRAGLHRLAGAIALLAALATKESAGAVACGIGLAWCCGAGPARSRRFTRRAGTAVAALGALVFAIDVVAIPRWLGSSYAYAGAYAQYGASPLDWALSPVLRAGEFWGHLFGPARLKFLLLTLAPLGFLPLLAPRALLAALPGYLMLFLSEGDHRISLQYHYAIEPAVGLLWATCAALAARSGRARKGGARLPLWVLFWALLAFGRSELYRVRSFQPGPQETWLTDELLPCLEPEPSVAATDALVPHLADRRWAHNLTDLRTASGQGVDCVLDDVSLKNWPLSPGDHEPLVESLREQGYAARLQCRSFTLYESPVSRCLRCTPKCEIPD